jgi:hypothetical protein
MRRKKRVRKLIRPHRICTFRLPEIETGPGPGQVSSS